MIVGTLSAAAAEKGGECEMGNTNGTIDFDAVARRIVELTDLRLIREQLMLVWNARGAADVVKLETELTAMMGASASGPYIKNLDRALRTLDR